MLRKSLIAGVAAGLAFAGTAHAGRLAVFPGVTYEHVLRFTPAGPLSLYVITAPRPVAPYGLQPLLSNGTIVGRETVSAMERDVSRQATTIGVNGDFFNWKSGFPSGVLVRNGVLEHQSIGRRSSLGVDADGTLHLDRVATSARWLGQGQYRRVSVINEPPEPGEYALFTPVWGAPVPHYAYATAAVFGSFPPLGAGRPLTGTVMQLVNGGGVAVPPGGAVLLARGEDAASTLAIEAPTNSSVTTSISLTPDPWKSIVSAVGGGPLLVRDGKPVAKAYEALTPVQLNGRDPRTAVGQRADGGIVVVAADGRRPWYSIGLSNWELARALVNRGCVTGMALDSGGSTTVALDGRLLNRPSDRYGERAVGEALVISYSGVYAPQPAPVVSPNGDGYAEQEALAYKLVRPSTVTARLVGPDGRTVDLDVGPRNPGTYRFKWDGRAPDGTVQLEGGWKLSVAAVDDTGRTTTIERPFALDDTLGFARAAATRRGMPVRTTFTLARPASVRVTLETPSGAVLRRIPVGARPAGPVAVRWRGRDGRGRVLPRAAYVVRITATSDVGRSEVTARLRVR